MKRPKYSIRDLLWATVCIALASGWWASVTHERRAAQHVKQLKAVMDHVKANNDYLERKNDYLAQAVQAYEMMVGRLLARPEGKARQESSPVGLDGLSRALDESLDRQSTSRHE